jgi:hypothetical protein
VTTTPLPTADGLDLDVLSDGELIERSAARLAVPRRDPADSFVLHAPLELMARAALLRLVEPAARDAARRRIAWLVETYEEAAPAEVPQASPNGDRAVPALTDAIAAGDLEAVDRATTALAAATTAPELVGRLADVVLPRLGAAAHGAIFLYHLPRLPGGADDGSRPAARDRPPPGLEPDVDGRPAGLRRPERRPRRAPADAGRCR